MDININQKGLISLTLLMSGTVNCGRELGGLHGRDWFVSSPPQLLYYLTSFGLLGDTKSLSPCSGFHLFSPCLLSLCLFLSKKCCIKSEYLYFFKTLLLFFISSRSALLSTHPVCKTLTHMPLQLSRDFSLLTPTSPKHPDLSAFSVLAARQKTYQKFIVFINIVYFISLEWRQGFTDLKYKNKFPSLLYFSYTPLLTAKTGAGVCARPGSSSWINMTLTAVQESEPDLLLD